MLSKIDTTLYFVFFLSFFIFELGGITKRLTTSPKGNSEFFFLLDLNIPLGVSLGNIEGLGKTKLTVSPGGQS